MPWARAGGSGYRHFSAVGRDELVPEVALVLEDGRLSATEGSRKTTRLDARVVAVTQVIRAAPGLSGTKVETALRDEHGLSRDEARDALRECKRRGYLRTETGKSRAVLHHVREPAKPELEPVRGSARECAGAHSESVSGGLYRSRALLTPENLIDEDETRALSDFSPEAEKPQDGRVPPRALSGLLPEAEKPQGQKGSAARKVTLDEMRQMSADHARAAVQSWP